MATAELAERAIATARPTPAWWRRWHSYAFVAVVGLNIGVGPLVVRLYRGLYRDDPIILGVVLGQCFLLGIWAALGGLRVLARWGLVALTLGIGVLAFVHSLSFGPDDFQENLLMGGLMGSMLVIALAVFLLPLRGLAGWRVDFDPAYHRDARLRRGQVAFLDFAGYTCAVAGVLTVVRMMVDATGENDWEGMAMLFAIVAVIAATSAIPAYLVLTGKRLWAALAVSVLWVAIAIHLHSWLALAYSDLQFFGSATLAGPTQVDTGLAMFHGSIAAMVVATLAILRFCGLKLLVVQPPAAGAA
jgi:hypothetical protein